VVALFIKRLLSNETAVDVGRFCLQNGYGRLATRQQMEKRRALGKVIVYVNQEGMYSKVCRQ
jgi:ABC-type glutathione transport system ATPase component